MPTVKEIHEFLQTLAPESMAMDWDHVGLLCGRSDREVRRILVALDPFLSVATEAAERDCRLLVTHHPLIWHLEKVNDGTPSGKTLLYLIEHGISALNAHTNLDCAPGGVNDCLAATLGLSDVSVIDPVGTDAEGLEYGLLRGGEVAPQTTAEFLQTVKSALKCEGLRYVDGGKTIRRVAVGGGACADSLPRVAALGYDAFVTADCKYNQFVDAGDLGVTLIDAGHFETENPVCTVLAEKLRKNFPEIEVLESKIHGDCIKFA